MDLLVIMQEQGPNRENNKETQLCQNKAVNRERTRMPTRRLKNGTSFFGALEKGVELDQNMDQIKSLLLPRTRLKTRT